VTIGILDYGMGNLRSVARAVERVGGLGAGEIVAEPAEATRFDALIVPGVGAFGACMRNLAAAGLDTTVREFVANDRPVLGVCLGLQVLYEAGDESPNQPGLGLLDGRVAKLPAGVKVPHMGWNEVTWTADHPLTRNIPSGTRMYFVHSYAAETGPDTVGTTEYGTKFSAAIARGRLFATQFHPEKSGDAGLALYESFVKEAEAS